MRQAIVVFLSSLLIACSASKKSMVVQIPNDAWWQSANADPSASSSEKNLAIVRQQMMKSVPFPFVVGLSDSTEINAYAQLQNNQRYIILTNGFITQFGNDPDVMAAVLGHELAHHQLGHTQPDYAKNRDAAIDVTSQALGMIASYFIPFSGLVVGNAAKGMGLTWSRNDERSADEMGMQWAMQAGYSPCGSYRFAAQMNALGEGAAIPFLSTHPGNNERMVNADRFTQNKKGAPCSSDPVMIQTK
ncbi:M48 family metallopeptidase [Polynucleobacter sp.]|uniref:M48 family metallopeptidase n=1 Tax=Polynucleobacter sp. TaxID=2029855 RepID=UPI00333F490E